jgi:hypothetical protein
MWWINYIKQYGSIFAQFLQTLIERIHINEGGYMVLWIKQRALACH